MATITKVVYCRPEDAEAVDQALDRVREQIPSFDQDVKWTGNIIARAYDVYVHLNKEEES